MVFLIPPKGTFPLHRSTTAHPCHPYVPLSNRVVSSPPLFFKLLSSPAFHFIFSTIFPPTPEQSRSGVYEGAALSEMCVLCRVQSFYCRILKPLTVTAHAKALVRPIFHDHSLYDNNLLIHNYLVSPTRTGVSIILCFVKLYAPARTVRYPLMIITKRPCYHWHQSCSP